MVKSYVRGPMVMKGYYKDPELTAQVIRDGWFHTGDIGKLIEGKYLKITDRKKEIFKTSGGKYIAPQLLENKLKESILIEQAMIVGENRKCPSALIVPNFDQLFKLCQTKKLSLPEDRKTLVQNSQIINLFQKEIDNINESLGSMGKDKNVCFT